MQAEGLFKSKPKPVAAPEPVVESPKKKDATLSNEKDSPDAMDFSPTSAELTDMQRQNYNSVKHEEKKQHDREEKK